MTKDEFDSSSKFYNSGVQMMPKIDNLAQAVDNIDAIIEEHNSPREEVDKEETEVAKPDDI